MKPSLKQIALELNLSTAAVSKALNGYPDISKNTKKRVYAYVKKIGYQPNTHARFLRTKKSQTIALILPNTTDSLLSTIAEDILVKAEYVGYNVLVSCSKESEEIEKRLVNRFLQQKVDGIIMSLSNTTSDYSHLVDIQSNTTTLILFNTTARTVNCNRVYLNDKEAAFNATNHLIANGCSQIAHFRGPLTPQNSIDRYLGYREALNSNKLPFDSEKILLAEKGIAEEGYALAKRLYNKNISIDGLFCFNDALALGAMRFFNEKGVKIPKDLCIMGFGNSNIGAYSSPSLSTVDHEISTMGAKIMEVFLDEEQSKKDNEEIVVKNILLNNKVIARESTLK